MNRYTLCVVLYLAAAVASNTAVSVFGPWALLVTATVAIPLDLTTRDLLHDRWHGRNLWPKMAALVLAGSALSFLTASPAVCIASAVAFGLSSLTDALAYHALAGASRMTKINGSNVASSIVDSLVFPWIAFHAFIPTLLVSQASLKIVGGLAWSILFLRLTTRRTA